MSEQALFEVLEADLRALSAEARRTDGNFATQITGWLQHTDYAQIKESAERAALKLRAIAQDGGGLAAVREVKVRLGLGGAALAVVYHLSEAVVVLTRRLSCVSTAEGSPARMQRHAPSCAPPSDHETRPAGHTAPLPARLREPQPPPRQRRARVPPEAARPRRGVGGGPRGGAGGAAAGRAVA